MDKICNYCPAVGTDKLPNNSALVSMLLQDTSEATFYILEIINKFSASCVFHVQVDALRSMYQQQLVNSHLI